MPEKQHLSKGTQKAEAPLCGVLWCPSPHRGPFMDEFRAYSCNSMRRADLASRHLIFLNCNMDPNEWSRGGGASVCSAPSPMQEARGH